MKRFTFMWFIENYSYCWHDTGEKLVSPRFFVETMQFTSWCLKIYPKGINDSNFLSLGLKRCENCCGPEEIAFNFQLSILDANGKVLESDKVEEVEFNFVKDGSYDILDFSERFGNEDEYLRKKDEVLTSDLLTVRCTMWLDGGKIDKEDFVFARTRIGFEKISFINIIESFTTIQSNHKKSITKRGLEFSGNIFIKREPDSEDELMIEILPHADHVHIISCHIYLVSSSGKEVECGKKDIRNFIDKINSFSFSLKFGKCLLDNKLEYLPNDSLTLRFECRLSSGIEFERIEETFYDLHLTPLLKKNLHDRIFSPFQAQHKSILNDFKSLLKNQILSDIKVKTLNKEFPAHKSVLTARSPVFRAMLTVDMKEKIMDCIEIDDLEDSTVQQFLLFLYTDVLEDCQWESIKKLYYAADKYQVQRLKDMCNSFLITGLNSRNMIDLLILSDRHQDFHLKKTVEKFICRREKDVFCTDEWEGFMEKSPELAMKTMHFYLKNSKN